MAYSPEVMVFALSRRCNIQCDHCIMEAGPHHKQALSIGTVYQLASQAKENGIGRAIIYGGEPFMHWRSLLPDALEATLFYGLTTSIATNGFWGSNRELAREVLTELNETVRDYKGYYKGQIHLGLSVDKYHQAHIPSEAIVNIIDIFRRGNFPNISLGITTFAGQDNWETLGEVYDGCRQRGIHLMESNDGRFMYPAVVSELIEYTPANYYLLAEKLKLYGKITSETIATTLIEQHVLSDVPGQSPTLITRQFDAGEGVRSYVIFPENRYLMDLTVEQEVINAGRSKKTSNPNSNMEQEFGGDHVIIAFDGQAYTYPAQITSRPGVEMGSKPLKQIINEIGMLVR